MTRAPTMTRSKNQLATAYAPDAFFTFEGGLGACIAAPDRDARFHEARISATVRHQIMQRLEDLVRSWFRRAYHCRADDAQRPVLAEQCVDEEFLDATREAIESPRQHRFAFIDPVTMGYEPAPLAFRCRTCELFRSYDSLHRLGGALNELKPDNCPDPKRRRRCDWQQLDVIFVHWSGTWAAPTPGRLEWSTADGDAGVRMVGDFCSCGSQDFLLNTDSAAIGKWFFKCARCGDSRGEQWLQGDAFTIGVLREQYSGRVREARMEPISYRASGAYYAHSEQFVLFSARDEAALGILEPGRQLELEQFIATQYGFTGAALSREQIQAQLIARGHEQEWVRYERQERLRDLAKSSGMTAEQLEDIEQELRDRMNGWFAGPAPLLHRPASLPPQIMHWMERRTEFAPRFDPFRLALEHSVLRQTTLDAPPDAYQRRAFVPFTSLDADLDPHGAPDPGGPLARATSAMLRQLGIARMGLIRNFDLCRFTYGYSRVNSLPVVVKHDMPMPVRLRLLPTVTMEDGPKHPIYVVTQSNEAIYVQLDEQSVYRWLMSLQLADRFDWTAGGPPQLGGLLLQRTVPFGRFLDNVGRGAPRSYLYTYTLLHTFAHATMKLIAENSGLDLGSLGEYLFPTDLAFVVYRNSTTMDLGNLSALWRNDNLRFLESLLGPRVWSCNSGTLCSEKGAACPDCLLVPETSCVAQNRLLCRSVVDGGRKPDEDDVNVDIEGYLAAVNRGA